MTSLAKLGPFVAVLISVTALRADDTAIRTATVSDAQMLGELQRINIQLKTDYREMLQLQHAAREQKDVIQLNCVNARLVEVKAHINIAETQSQQLQVAIEKNSSTRTDMYKQLSVTYSSVAKLRDEARACVGTAEMHHQESGVEVTQPDIADDPTADDPFRTSIEPPAYASPFF